LCLKKSSKRHRARRLERERELHAACARACDRPRVSIASPLSSPASTAS
jgi:hypothetical protein